MLRSVIVLAAAAAVMAGSLSGASAADAASGKALVDKNCAACHAGMMAMWKDKSAAVIDGRIHEVLSGKVPHPKDLKPLGLTDAQIADIAAYWAGAAK